MDVCKIGPGCYQYTAIDDCSRYAVVSLYDRRTAKNTLRFLDKVVEEMPFAIQRIQTEGPRILRDRGAGALRAWAIKFRPIKPRLPQLEGQVERAQRTSLQEFWSSFEVDTPELEQRRQEWHTTIERLSAR